MQLLNAIKSHTDASWSSDKSKKVTAQIYWKLLGDSKHLNHANFSKIEATDIESLFEMYDESFFDGNLKRTLRELRQPITFRLSGKMTRAGGKTTREESWRGKRLINRRYEIAISTTLLFQTFQNQTKPVIVTGISCGNRLQALQRIMEHEIIHLVEMMVWYHSDCFRKRFKTITNRLFDHTESTHQLTTVDERALTEFGIKVGDVVLFQHERKTYTGFVNRITKRATVLVEHAAGERFSDGKRYARFYVPIQSLRPVPRTAWTSFGNATLI